MGTTSACAENTHHIKLYRYQQRNYLRVRGEYAASPPLGVSSLELPPRARRIRRGWGFRAGGLGNYLRVRGEYETYTDRGLSLRELPPRARRIRVAAS